MKSLGMIFTGLALVGTLGAGRANAALISIGGINVDSENFVDALLSDFTTDIWVTAGDAPLATSVTDQSADTWAFSNATQAYLQLGFTDNVMFNGPGDDLVIWEIGTPDNFGISLTVGGVTHTIPSAATPFNNAQGFRINVAFLDLDDLGLAPGAEVTSFVANMGFPFAETSNSPTFGAAAALNSRPPQPAPEPGSMLLLLGGLSALVVRRRRV